MLYCITVLCENCLFLFRLCKLRTHHGTSEKEFKNYLNINRPVIYDLFSRLMCTNNANMPGRAALGYRENSGGLHSLENERLVLADEAV